MRVIRTHRRACYRTIRRRGGPACSRTSGMAASVPTGRSPRVGRDLRGRSAREQGEVPAWGGVGSEELPDLLHRALGVLQALLADLFRQVDASLGLEKP